LTQLTLLKPPNFGKLRRLASIRFLHGPVIGWQLLAFPSEFLFALTYSVIGDEF